VHESRASLPQELFDPAMMAYSPTRVTAARVSAPPKGGLPEKGAFVKGTLIAVIPCKPRPTDKFVRQPFERMWVERQSRGNAWALPGTNDDP
jgi:hypothetical protein